MAVAFEARDLSYAELELRSEQAAGMLLELGAKPGDRIAWLGRSCAEWYEIFFGAAKARTCLAPINSRLAIPEIAFILQDSGADLFFVTQEFFAAAEQVVAQVDRPIRVVAVYGEHPGFDSYPRLRDAAPPPKLTAPEMEDDVLQLYTSGTTGLPKGVRLNNTNYAAFLELRHHRAGLRLRRRGHRADRHAAVPRGRDQHQLLGPGVRRAGDRDGGVQPAGGAADDASRSRSPTSSWRR